MGTALAVIDSGEMDTVVRAGKMLAASGYFDGKGESNQAIAMMATKIMAGREMGFGPFASVNGVHIISGKPTIGANLMASAVKGSGRYDYRVKVMSSKECELEFFEKMGDKRESLGVSTFNMDDARDAGVLNNPTWKKYPRNMLFARALSNGVRWYCPDIFSGNAVYVPEELGAEVDGDGNVVDSTYTVVSPQQAPAPATANVSLDVVFDEAGSGDVPWYASARSGLTNGTAALVDKMLDIHRNGQGPCSEKQYQYLAGLIDSLPDVGKDGHGKVLSIICQSEINSNNRPAFDLATKLLDYLPTHTKVEGNKVENPNYRADVVEHITKIARTFQAELAFA